MLVEFVNVAEAHPGSTLEEGVVKFGSFPV